MAKQLDKLSAEFEKSRSVAEKMLSEMESIAPGYQNAVDATIVTLADVERMRRKLLKGGTKEQFHKGLQIAKEATAAVRQSSNDILRYSIKFTSVKQILESQIKEMQDIRDTLAKEVASRKKKKLVKSKSLPMLENLHKEVENLIKSMVDIKDTYPVQPPTNTFVKTLVKADLQETMKYLSFQMEEEIKKLDDWDKMSKKERRG